MYRIERKNITEDGGIYQISLNAEHPVFRAHFAGNPVMPGACIVQMLQEIAEDFFGCRFFLKSARNVKFLAVINPVENKSINVQLHLSKKEGGETTVTASIAAEGKIFSKATLVLEKRPHEKDVRHHTDI